MNTDKTQYLHRLDIKLKTEDCEIAQAYIFNLLPYGFEEENIDDKTALIRIHCEFKEQLDEIKELLQSHYSYAIFEESIIENKEWTEAWKEYFTPVEAGDFLVLPSWEKGKQKTKDTITLYIEPKSAFGTGHHATTALCLHSISQLYKDAKIKKGMNFLDLGCGSGILGIATYKLGLTGLCTDIDPIAIANTEENLALNDIQNGIDLTTGSIDKVSEKYDIIIANILAAPLVELANSIMAQLKENSCLVLSGILSSQADMICKAYAKLGTPIKLEAFDIPHICPENIATDEVKPAETWVSLTWIL